MLFLNDREFKYDGMQYELEPNEVTIEGIGNLHILSHNSKESQMLGMRNYSEMSRSVGNSSFEL